MLSSSSSKLKPPATFVLLPYVAKKKHLGRTYVQLSQDACSQIAIANTPHRAQLFSSNLLLLLLLLLLDRSSVLGRDCFLSVHIKDIVYIDWEKSLYATATSAKHIRVSSPSSFAACSNEFCRIRLYRAIAYAAAAAGMCPQVYIYMLVQRMYVYLSLKTYVMTDVKAETLFCYFATVDVLYVVRIVCIYIQRASWVASYSQPLYHTCAYIIQIYILLCYLGSQLATLLRYQKKGKEIHLLLSVQLLLLPHGGKKFHFAIYLPTYLQV